MDSVAAVIVNAGENPMHDLDVNGGFYMIRKSRCYDRYFEGYKVPKDLKEKTILIMKRFSISGICDGMYICNAIANICGIGDGNGHFTNGSILKPRESAEFLQCAYGCNIHKDEIPELIAILKTGILDMQKTSSGIKRYITDCEDKKKSCYEWEKEIYDRFIREARENLNEFI